VRLIVLLGAEAGLRIGEVQALRWDDIDFTRRILTVNRRDWRGRLGSPKGGRIRRVPLTTRLVAALKAHRHLMAWVVCQPDGARYTQNHVTSRLGRACRRAGLRIATYHVMRHTFCSHLAMRGASARAIQELAGHASIVTTQRYMHLAPAAGRDAIELLERRGPTVAPHEVTARK
jgi:integrase